MKINIEKIIKPNEIETLMKKYIQYDEEEDIKVGSVSLQSLVEFIIQLMNLWVSRVENILKVSQNTKYYQLIKQQRGFNYQEFLCLFDEKIREQDYRYYPVFTQLNIFSESIKRRYFAQFINRSLEPNIQSYLEVLHKSNLIVCNFFLKQLAAYIPYKSLKTHAYISGGTGSGKTELMKLIFYDLQRKSQAKNSNSLVILDPHSDLVKETRALHLNRGKEGRERLIFLDPFLAKGHTFTINPLQLSDRSEENITLMSQQLVKAFKEVVPNNVSTNMGNLLYPCISTLMREGNASLSDLNRFMSDELNDDLVYLGKQSPKRAVREFFEHDFFDKQQYGKTKSALRARIQYMLLNPVFNNLVTGKSTIDLETELNAGKVILFNLSKGASGSAFLDVFGRFVMATILGIAFKRAAKEKAARKPTFVLLDECQNFMTESVIEVLAEARKYGLHLILANQYFDQLGKEYKAAFRSNTNIKIAGINDREHFKQIAPSMDISYEELLKLPNYNFWVKSRGRKPKKFQTDAFLIEDKRYSLTKEELKELDHYMVHNSGYYKPIREEGENESNQFIDHSIPDAPKGRSKRKFRFDL